MMILIYLVIAGALGVFIMRQYHIRMATPPKQVTDAMWLINHKRVPDSLKLCIPREYTMRDGMSMSARCTPIFVDKTAIPMWSLIITLNDGEVKGEFDIMYDKSGNIY